MDLFNKAKVKKLEYELAQLKQQLDKILIERMSLYQESATLKEELEHYRQEEAKRDKIAEEAVKEANRKRQQDANKAFHESFSGIHQQQSSFSYDDLQDAMNNMRGSFDTPHFNFGGARRSYSQQTRGFNANQSHAQQKPVTLRDIKLKYREQAKIHHPDVVRANGGSSSDIARAEKKMQELNAQYEKDKARYK